MEAREQSLRSFALSSPADSARKHFAPGSLRLLAADMRTGATRFAAGCLHGGSQAKPGAAEEVAGTFEALYEYDTIKVEVDTVGP
jgi:hypothetical protein